MKSITPYLLTLACLTASCGEEKSSFEFESTGPQPRDIVLAFEPAEGEIDRRIARRQQEVRDDADAIPSWDRLGALFIAKARSASDPGYYELARQCAAVIESIAPGDLSGRMLEGLVLHNLHRFAEAESIARELVDERGNFQDQGLLGDVLLDRGELRAALACYQKMLYLKPCLQSYARAARVRWLRGDVPGARELLELAAGAGSRRDPEALAWVWSERARIELNTGDLTAARRAADAALEVLPNYPAALLTLGRVQLASGETVAAAESLREAASRRGEPEYLWALEEALLAGERTEEAADVAARLRRTGARDDARTFSLYLATREQAAETALQLAETELESRTDVFTRDAHAWALHRSGDNATASAVMERALEHETPDPRLWYHAGVIAHATGDVDAARRHLERASRCSVALTPTERAELTRRMSAL